MSVALRTNGNGNKALARDPFALARELFSWDPFFGGRPASAFAPAFEVKETAEAFVLKADLPGVSEDKLDIAVDKNVLVVSGSREAEDHKEDEAYSIYERQFGTFTRSFQLPDTADGERIDAKLDGGVLTLTIGKKPEAKPRKIAIKR